MLGKLRDRFIEECRAWYKLWSSWLAIAWGLVVAFFWNSPETLGQILSVMPEPYRAYISPIIFAIAAGLPIVVRLLKQNKLGDSNAAANRDA